MTITQSELHADEDISLPGFVIDHEAVAALGTETLRAAGQVLVGRVEVGLADWDLGRAVCGLMDKLGTGAQITCAQIPGEADAVVGLWVSKRQKD